MKLDTSFSCYLMSVTTLNILVLRKHRLFFLTLPLFYLNSLSFGRSLSKNKQNPIFCGLPLIFVTVLCSTNGLFIWILRLLSFFFIFEHNCIFYEFILFSCRIFALLTNPIKGNHSRKNSQRWKKA